MSGGLRLSKKCEDLDRGWLAGIQALDHRLSMRAECVDTIKHGNRRKRPTGRPLLDAATPLENKETQLAAVRRFKRCDMRGVTGQARQSSLAIRKRFDALRVHEGLIVIVSSPPDRWLGELCQLGFCSKREPGQNDDWFVWLWRKCECVS
jgi:hypothetical protein